MKELSRKQSRRFCLVLIKPSHYDDDGYVIQWFRSAIPSNSLAVLYGLALKCAAQKIKRDPRRYQYRDGAVEPVADDKIETEELFQSAVAQAYVHRVQRLEEIRRGRAV